MIPAEYLDAMRLRLVVRRLRTAYDNGRRLKTCGYNGKDMMMPASYLSPLPSE